MNNKDKTGVFIMGNGFDLDLGLKTRYKDFVETTEGESFWYGNRYLQEIKEKCDNKKWIDIEEELRNIAVERYGMYKGQMFYAGDNELVEACEILTVELMKYLEGIKYSSINTKESYAERVLSAIYQLDTFQIYSFNYTPIEKVLEYSLRSSSSINYVHGSITNKTAILGIDDNVEILKSDLGVVKTYNQHHKPSSIAYDMLDADDILIFGHSLGTTDYHYFERFFQRQSEKELDREKQKIIRIFTYDNASRLEILYQLRRMNNKQTNYLMNQNDFKIFCTKEGEDNEEEIREYFHNLKIRQEKQIRRYSARRIN